MIVYETWKRQATNATIYLYFNSKKLQAREIDGWTRVRSEGWMDGWMEAKKEIDFMAQHKREGGGKGKEKDGRRDPQQLNVM